MSYSIAIDVSINGKQALYSILSCSISQPIDGHHHFSVRFTAEGLLGSEKDAVEQLTGFLGNRISIAFKYEQIGNHDTSSFLGIITNASLASTEEEVAAIVLEGFSPTILLDGTPQLNSFEEKKLDQLISDTTSAVARDILKINSAPTHSAVIPYAVQYNETPYAFIRRMCNAFGDWVYYDGSELVIGKLKDYGTPNILSYPGHLSDVEVKLKISPQKFSMGNWDQTKNAVLIKEGAASPPPSNTLVKQAVNESQKAYTIQAASFGNYSDAELPDVSSARIKSNYSDILKVTGICYDPLLHPGKVIELKMEASAYSGSRSIGNFVVTQVVHSADARSNYTCTFEAIPQDDAYPDSTAYPVPFCGVQPAVVTDNKDPDKMGRVKVKLHWQNSPTPWVPVSVPHAGKERGFFFMPEINDEVLVGFQNGDASQPYVAGSIWHGKSLPEPPDDKNQFKRITTKSGNAILFDDTAGKETLQIINADGSNSIVLTMDSGGSVEITSKNVMNFEAKEMNFKSDKILFDAQQTIDVKAGQKITMKGTSEVSLAGANIKVSADAEVAIKGNASAKLQGAQVSVKGDAQASVEGGAMAVLKGGIVMIN